MVVDHGFEERGVAYTIADVYLGTCIKEDADEGDGVGVEHCAYEDGLLPVVVLVDVGATGEEELCAGRILGFH